MQDTCGVTNPTGVHRHLDDLVFDLRRLPWIAIVQQEGATSTALLSAPVPLLALTGLAMANNIRTLAVGTVQDLENHDATRSRWGCSAAETFIKNSTSTPVRHLPAPQASVRGPRGPEPCPVRATPEDSPPPVQACLHRGGARPLPRAGSWPGTPPTRH